MGEEQLTPELARLIQAAREAAAHAYAPYSGLRVGAAVLAASGRIYPGCNVENSSYPVGLCAERNAVGSAVAAGERELQAIALSGGMEELQTLTPCGMCRQFLVEFGELTVVTKQDGHWVAEPLSALLPSPFRLTVEE